MQKIIKNSLIIFFIAISLTRCGGGGGGGGGGGSDLSGVWNAQAAITNDGCGERIASVNQQFIISSNGSGINVDSGIIVLSSTVESGNFSIGFEESNGDCVRNYEAHFSDISAGTANVSFSATSNCGGNVCKNEWAGIATKVG